MVVRWGEQCSPGEFDGSAGSLRASNARAYGHRKASLYAHYFGPGGVNVEGDGKALRKMQHSCIF